MSSRDCSRNSIDSLEFEADREYSIEGKFKLLELTHLWSESDVEMVVA